MSTPNLQKPTPPTPNATISDAINYVGQNPAGVIGAIVGGVKEIIKIIALIFKPGIKGQQ